LVIQTVLELVFREEHGFLERYEDQRHEERELVCGNRGRNELEDRLLGRAFVQDGSASAAVWTDATGEAQAARKEADPVTRIRGQFPISKRDDI
jgi:hypothetical protein